MRIGVFSSASIHDSGAYVNRCLSLARGMALAGNDVRILCLDGSAGRAASGEWEGIPFEHANVSASGKGARGLAMIRESRRIALIEARRAPDAVLFFGLKPWQLFPAFRVLRARGIPVFQEFNEHPHIMVRNRTEWFLVPYFIRRQVPKYNGLVLMTRYLVEFFQAHSPRCPPLIHVPMTVEPDRFVSAGASPFPFPYLGYCGALHGEKDGVGILVKAFAMIAPEFPDLRMVLIGDPQYGGCQLADRVRESGVQERIVLTGVLRRDQIPAYLCHATALALARPRSLQASGGFPTKLGEYLATGRPVVVTKVGEIGEYLADGETAFLADPDSPESFAAALRAAMRDPERADRIGRAGKQVAETAFHFRVQGKRLADFMRLQVGRNRRPEGAGASESP